MMRCLSIFALVATATIGSTSALVDAGRRTTVTVDASAYDERTSSSGCSPDGCVPENTRDGSRRSNSRWSCSEDLEDKQCKICYDFHEPQDIVDLKISFHKGDERTRKLKVKTNGRTWGEIESSGETSRFETFELDTDETADLCLESIGLDGDEWISIKEVRFMVK